MGVHASIQHGTFPKQRPTVGNPARVCFHYDLDNTVQGIIVRDDEEEPFVTIFRLKDGRYVLATECQWSPL